MSSDTATEIYHLLVAHVLNDSIETANYTEQRVVELELGQFLEKLNDMAKAYRKTFQYPEEMKYIDGEFIKNLVQFSEFNSFVSLDNDKLKVDFTPQKFQSLLTGILVDSSIRYSKLLAREVDDLAEKYLELQPPVPTLTLTNVESKSPVNTQENEMIEAEDADDELETEKSENVKGEEVFAKDVTMSDVEQNDQQEQPVEPEKTIIENDTSENDTEAGDAQDLAAETAADFEDDTDQEANQVEQLTDEVEYENEEDEKNICKSESPTNELLKEVKEAEDENGKEPLQEEEIEMADEIKGEIESTEMEEEEIEEESPKAEEPIGASTLAKEELIIEERPLKRSLSPLVVSQKHKRFQNIAINLVKTIEEHRFSSPFLVPVVADQYEEVVYDPKNLKSILKAIKQKDEPAAYGTVKELERDIMLMFANCVMYNKSSAHLVGMAKQMRDDVRNTFKMFEEAESEIA